MTAFCGFDSGRLEVLKRRLDTHVTQGDIPGGVVLMARRGLPVVEHVFGLLAPGRPDSMRSDALFRIYSMTKPLVSVAALTLVEDGRLQLNDRVDTYLPELADLRVSTPDGHVAMQSPVTIHHLLTHTSGLFYGIKGHQTAARQSHAELGIPVNPRDLTTAEFIRRLSLAPLLHQPGQAWEYGLSTDVLGVVIERITGMRLGDYLRQVVFEPLGMDSTGFVVRSADAARIAQPFPQDPATGLDLDYPSQTFDAVQVPGMDAGGAGCIASATDYLLFGQMLLNRGSLDGVRILGPKTVDWMTANHLGPGVRSSPSPGEAAFASPGFGFGLGLGVRLAEGMATIPGSTGSYFWSGTAGTMFWADPRERLQFVYMTQAPGAMRQHFRRLITALVYQAVAD